MDSDPIEKIVSDILKKYSENYIKDAFELLVKLFGNILKNPTEEKFRMFKRSNEALKKKVCIIKENLELLLKIGYQDVDGDILAFSGNNFANLEKAKKALEREVLSISSKTVSKEELEQKQREELAKKSADEIKLKMIKEREEQKKIQDQIKADQKESLVRDKPTDSVANQLKFGATECKVEFKNSGGGGG